MMQKGSSTLVVLLTLSSVSLFAIAVFRNTIFFHDISLAKQRHEQFFRRCEAALNIGIALCKKYPKRFFITQEQEDNNESKPFVASVNRWLGNNDDQATIEIFPSRKKVEVKSFLLHDGRMVCGLHCFLELEGKKKGKQMLKITNWSFNTLDLVRKKKKKR